jgi:hypothetical protein
MTKPAYTEEIDMPLAASRRCPIEPPAAARMTDREIRNFLAGKSDGAELLHMLYDHVLDEPIPQRLRGLVSRRMT